MVPNNGFQFAIDRGGTFTDVFARCPDGRVRVMKLLSVDPQNYDDAPREAIRRILQEETHSALDKDGKVNSSLIKSIRMGTTVATNALLERKGAKMALVINKGFKDLLLIGNQARPNIFELDIKRPGVLYTEVIEVDCRVIPALENRCQIDPKTKSNWKIVTGTTDEKMCIIKDLDEEVVRKDLQELRKKGIESIAVVLAHSYTFHDHELRIGRIAEELGFTQVSLSHAVTSMIRLAPRGYTASADAYLTPHIKQYINSFSAGFSGGLKGANVLFMQSDGGLTPMELFNGFRAILSGPAGGVVGYALTSYQKEVGLPVIGFDMGGTSTDVSRYAGALEHVTEATTAGVTIQAPQLDINTVAAGGGSMLSFRSGLFSAGPQSAGAQPGPACYRKGGPLTVTDANLLLGRLLPEYFPKIFGPNENEPLDKEATVAAFKNITDEINSFLKQDGGKEMTMEEVAMGFINVANEAMCRPIRALTTARGHDASQHALACFGGAGGQHACAVAAQLGITTVLLHKYAGILSAYGMALADVVHEAQAPCAVTYCPNQFQYLDTKLDQLAAECRDQLGKQGFTKTQIFLEPYLNMRYAGTDTALMIAPETGSGDSRTGCRHGDFYTAFVNSRIKVAMTAASPGVPATRLRGDHQSCVGASVTHVQEMDQTKSVVASPLSAEFTLALAALGATGTAHEELLKGLGFPDNNSVQTAFIFLSASLKSLECLTLANKIYLQEGLELLPRMKKYAEFFNTEYGNVNFADSKTTSDEINNWVEQETNGKIKEIYTSDGSEQDTGLVLLNAVYFKGSWLHPFDRKDTQFAPFRVDSSKVISVPMMKYRKHEQFMYGSSGDLQASGFTKTQIFLEPYLNMRYAGTDTALMIAPETGSGDSRTGCRHGDFYTAFVNRYKREFGFTLVDRDVLVDDVRVRAVGKSETVQDVAPPGGKGTQPVEEKTVKVYFDGGYQDTKVYLLDKLKPEQIVPGPAIIMDSLSTVLIEPNCRAEITKYGDIKIVIGTGKPKTVTTELDSIQLSIFSHRFMSIAEQMGRVLQRTSISVNIKERLDFSCALFGADGGLVSNAPHIPVHLGAMQETVQYQMKVRGGQMKPGDVYLANHPKAGGSHLPDLTVITPVFHGSQNKPIFFVASRGHHADIGGLTPGSMPPHSTSLAQEGAAFTSFLLLDGGVFREKELVEELNKPGKEPGCSGTRNLSDNLSDLKAQVAANQRGIQLVGELIDQYGLEVVQAYMAHIQKNAEIAVRDLLKEIAEKVYANTGTTVLKATDYMDNGTPIVLTVTLDKENGSAVCDFTGTGVEVWGNLNAPRAITLSALIYCLRCMVGRDAPLNQGCLAPIRVVIPPASILDPSAGAAVVGGNVLTSQRIVDVVFKAFQVCAASQGCMNNLTLGESDWGYYETVAGGSGAGPGWHGLGGVHTHMTNTRITDVEIVEKRYPILVTRFSLRAGSGGAGCWRGGDGVTRELLFRRTVQLSVLTERRAFQPYGMKGGEAGERGLNLLQRADGRLISLGGKASVTAYPGDKYIMNSPGGGGYGFPQDIGTLKAKDQRNQEFLQRGSVYEYKSAQESA